MTKAAGLTTMREPRGLLADNPDERPADIFITGWRIPGTEFIKHAIDLTVPLPDSAFAYLPMAQQRQRAATIGVTGRHSETRKRDNTGSLTDQRQRGNSFTMKERCRLSGINFLPVALEGDGCASKTMMTFIKNVSDSAHHLKDANRSAFKSYFMSRIANTLHQVSAKLALRQTAACRQKLLSYSSNPLIGLEKDIDLSQELQTTLPAFVCKRREWRQRNNNLGVSARSFGGVF